MRLDLAEKLEEKLGLYLVVDPEQTEHELHELVDHAIEGGVTAVQLRAKQMRDDDALYLAMRLRAICHSSDVLFLVNDRLDLALAAQADGVHLGVHDLPPFFARWIAGPEFVIGYSPETDYQAAQARSGRESYLGVGPVFATSSKADAGDPLGLEGFVKRIEYAEVPVIGIGGITAATAASVVEAGAAGVAVVSAILRASDPKQAATELAGRVKAGLRGRHAG